ncbi:MAG: thrCA, partial [Acidimicrobiaceae bacterium]|nr:thrCA [Acidimicrobiaceae bacterium]
GAFYASHIFNPLFHHGTKTFAFELYEQLGGNLPEAILLPAGNGTLLIGAAIGFRELIATGNLDHMPRLVAVQAERCAPLANAHSRHATAGLPTAPGRATLHTVAEGIAIAEPPRLAQMLEIIEDSGGSVRTVSEDAILDARAALARRGIDVEPTAATGYAAWREWSQESRPSSAVVALTGAGLKSPASA